MSIAIRPRAALDLEIIADSIRQEQDQDTVDVVMGRVNRTLERLELLPLSAEQYEPPDPEYPGLRYTVVHRTRLVIYYQPVGTGIVIVRVLHGSMDARAIFGPE